MDAALRGDTDKWVEDKPILVAGEVLTPEAMVELRAVIRIHKVSKLRGKKLSTAHRRAIKEGIKKARAAKA
jgi:hypothetical protein